MNAGRFSRPPGSPAAAAPIASSSSSDSEIYQSLVVAPATNSIPYNVCATKRRWTTADVYIDTTGSTVTSGLNGLGCIVVQLWVVTQGTKVLVASGRFGASEISATKKLIAYRGQAERYEVVAFQVDGALGTQGTFKVSAIFTDFDQQWDNEAEAGLISAPQNGAFSGAVVATKIGIASDPSPWVEIWKIFATSSVASRFLLIATPAGIVLSLPLSGGNLGIHYTGRALLRVPPGSTFQMSSTAITQTNVGAGDSGAVVYYR
jgi:hypothetical protein